MPGDPHSPFPYRRGRRRWAGSPGGMTTRPARPFPIEVFQLGGEAPPRAERSWRRWSPATGRLSPWPWRPTPWRPSPPAGLPTP